MIHVRKALGQFANECRIRLHRRRVRADSAEHDIDKTREVMHELSNVGFAVLPDFLDRSTCEMLVHRIDAALTEYASFVQVDESLADHRLFGLDAVDEEVRAVAFAPFVLNLLQRYQSASRYEGFALCARLEATSKNRGSGQGWHRDAAAYQQVKCMVYLSDVAGENGPFQYIAGSHRPTDVVRCAGKYGFEVNQHRFTDAQVQRLLDAETSRLRTLTAPAGTAILFDSRAIHRGMPIVSGTRYAITSYLWFDMLAPDHIRKWTIESQCRDGPVRGRAE